jgi:hypothetical protein
MALEITQGGAVAREESEVYIADRHLWLDNDGNVVEHGDPSATVLYATEGHEIPVEEAEAKGLVREKQAAKPENKQRDAAKDK